MSLFDNSEYRWRETHLLFLSALRRPSAESLERAIDERQQRFQLRDLKADDDGLLESVTLIAADAFAAIDISFVVEEQINEQIGEIRKEMQEVIEDPEELAKLERLSEFDARLDILHFERLGDVERLGEVMDEDDEFSASFDPGALLSVIDALTELSGGVCLDPASATVM